MPPCVRSEYAAAGVPIKIAGITQVLTASRICENGPVDGRNGTKRMKITVNT